MERSREHAACEQRLGVWGRRAAAGAMAASAVTATAWGGELDVSLARAQAQQAGSLKPGAGDVLARAASAQHRSLDLSSVQPKEQAAEAAAPASGGADEELAKQLSNPIADLISVPLQLNYDEGFGPNDAERITLNIQPVIPFSLSPEWNVISRTIVPVIYQGSIADGVGSDTGIGDTVQSLFFSPKEPVGGWVIGVGPVALIPTGTEPRLRNESLGFGPTAVVLRQSDGWTYGVLANHIWSVTDSNDHDEVNATFLQPFLGYTWPTATTVTLNMEATYDWSSEQWTVPINLIGSQLVRVGRQPVSFAIGGRYYADSPAGGPEWGARFVVTFLFPR